MRNPSVFVDGENILSGDTDLQENAEIVIVFSHETHIWIHGTHYTTVGEVTDSDDVSPGDLFFADGSGMYQIEQVLSINESSGEDKPTVDLGTVYTEGESINEVAEPPYSDAYSNMHVEQGMVIGHFTGFGKDAGMGYAGPPVKLEKVETE